MTARAVLVVGTALCLVLAGCGRPAADRTPDVADGRTEPAEPDASTAAPGPSPSPPAGGPASAPATVARDDATTDDVGTEQGPTADASDPTADASDPADDPPDDDSEDDSEDDTEVTASVLPGQFTTFVGGIGNGESCPDDDEPAPYVGRSPWLDQVAEAGSTVLLCIGGFDPAAPVDLAVASPTDEHVVQVLPADGTTGPPVGIDLRAVDVVTSASLGNVAWRRVQWWLAPGSPLGTWTLTATQGPATATIAVDVEVGTIPRFTTVDLVATTWVFHASGFPPGASAVGLYRPTTPRADLGPTDEVELVFVQELDPIVVDDTGAGVLSLDLAGVEPGEWCVTTAAAPESCQWVIVE